MPKFLPSFVLLFFCCSYAIGQLDPCITTDKKQKKAIETINQETNFEKASLLLKEAIKSYPENAEIPFIYAKRAYYIGSILLSNGEKEKAAVALQEFLDFPQDDFTRLPTDNETKRTQVEKFLVDYLAEKALFDNPVPFEPKLVLNVSSALDEDFPMISPDNDLLFFTRKVDRANLGDIGTNIKEEFSVATRNGQVMNFSSGDPLPKPFNDGTFVNYGTATLSVDNKEMIICACKNEMQSNGQNYLNCDLFRTEYERSGAGGNDFTWTPLENMGPGINTSNGWAFCVD